MCASFHRPVHLVSLSPSPILPAPEEFLAFGQKGQFQPYLGPLKILVSTSSRLIKNFLKTKIALPMKGPASRYSFSHC